MPAAPPMTSAPPVARPPFSVHISARDLVSVAIYTVFSGWFIGRWIPFFAHRDEDLRSPTTGEMGADYTRAFETRAFETRAFEQIVSTPAVLADSTVWMPEPGA